MKPYTKGKSERVDWNGITFYRYPESHRRNLRVYFAPAPDQVKKGVEMLHREIYKAHHGPIPPGRHVHHRDGNPLNNDPSNLEILTPSEHAKEHVGDEAHARLRESGRKRFQEFQSKHVKWRTETEEGREWARANAAPLVAAKAEKRGIHRITCEVCGTATERPGQADGSPPKYCSDKCNQTACRRRAGIGRAEHPFTCAHCGKTGVTTRNVRRYCDRRCKSLARAKT